MIYLQKQPQKLKCYLYISYHNQINIEIISFLQNDHHTNNLLNNALNILQSMNTPLPIMGNFYAILLLD